MRRGQWDLDKGNKLEGGKRPATSDAPSQYTTTCPPFSPYPDMHLPPHNSKPISTQMKAAKGRSAHQDFAFL